MVQKHLMVEDDKIAEQSLNGDYEEDHKEVEEEVVL